MKKVLVLCTANSCRSQMAEGYLRRFAGNEFEIYSAGITSHGIHPKAIQMMREDGIDISLHTSNVLDEYAAIHFDFIITVCDYALESCPVFLQAKKRYHHSFPDPAKATGSEAEIDEKFREIRNSIKDYCISFIAENANT